MSIIRDGKTGVGERSAPASILSMSIDRPSDAAVAFPFPVLDGADVGIRFEDVGEFLLDIFIYAKFETIHATDDLAVEFVGPKGLAVDEMGIGRTREPPDHP